MNKGCRFLYLGIYTSSLSSGNDGEGEDHSQRRASGGPQSGIATGMYEYMNQSSDRLNPASRILSMRLKGLY